MAATNEKDVKFWRERDYYCLCVKNYKYGGAANFEVLSV